MRGGVLKPGVQPLSLGATRARRRQQSTLGRERKTGKENAKSMH